MSAAEFRSSMDRLVEFSDSEVSQRSIPSAPIYFAVFASMLLVTPIARRFPGEVALLGAITLSLSLLRLYLALGWRRLYHRRTLLWRRLFFLSLSLTAASFGSFCAYTLASLELGWTSFFVVLVTCGMSAGMVSALAPNYRLLSGFLSLMLIPSAVVNFAWMGGLRGYALGGFFLGYLALLLWEGRMQNRTYWLASRSRARLQAMVDAIPGTLSWISSDLKYLGINQKQAELWKRHPSDFIGKRLGFADSSSEMIPFAQKLFESPYPQTQVEMKRGSGDQARTYFVVGRKCHLDSEAILLGIDVTEYKTYQKQVHAQQAQIKHSSALASLGEMSEDLAEEIHAPLKKIKEITESIKIEGATCKNIEGLLSITEKLASVEQALRIMTRPASQNGKDDLFSVKEIIKDAIALCGERFKKAGIQLKTRGPDPSVLEGHRVSSEILHVLVNLLNNSYDALKFKAESWARIEVALTEDALEISVTDSGAGISPEHRDRIFEPLYSTKSVGSSSGVGLSVSRTVVENHGGTLQLDTGSNHTRFIIRLPVQSREAEIFSHHAA